MPTARTQEEIAKATYKWASHYSDENYASIDAAPVRKKEFYKYCKMSGIATTNGTIGAMWLRFKTGPYSRGFKDDDGKDVMILDVKAVRELLASEEPPLEKSMDRQIERETKVAETVEALEKSMDRQIERETKGLEEVMIPPTVYTDVKIGGAYR